MISLLRSFAAVGAEGRTRPSPPCGTRVAPGRAPPPRPRRPPCAARTQTSASGGAGSSARRAHRAGPQDTWYGTAGLVESLENPEKRGCREIRECGGNACLVSASSNGS